MLVAGPRALGLIEGVAEATAILLKLFSGVLMDKRGYAKGWVAGGYALAALSRPLFYLAASWPAVLLLRFADRVGKGLRTSPRDALLAGAVDESRRGLAFGLHRAMDNAGAVIDRAAPCHRVVSLGYATQGGFFVGYRAGNYHRCAGAFHQGAVCYSGTKPTPIFLEDGRLSARLQTLSAGAGPVHLGQFIQYVFAAAGQGTES